jgi:TolB-like protein
LKVGAAYVVVGWLAVQAASIGFPAFEAPPWALRVFIFVALLGFPVALVLAWAVDLTPEGLKIDPSGVGSKRIFFAAAALAALAIAWVAFDQLPREGSAPAARSIAVLPFVNMSDNAGDEFFADGLSDEILNSLARIDGLQVVGRTSSFQFKGRNVDLREVGAKLGVAKVLEGSVRRGGNTVRITAQLVRVADGFHVWSKTYDRTMTDVLAVQLDIAEQVAGAMDVLLDDAQRERMREFGISNVESYIALEKGLALSVEAHTPGANLIQTLKRADVEFARAVALDPRSAGAHHWRTDLPGHILLGEDSTAQEREAALAFVRGELDLAVRAVRDPRQRLHIEIDRQLYSNDWRGLAGRVEALRVAPGCSGDSWFTVAFPFGVAESMLADAQRRIACDPLAETSYLEPATAALWAGRPERAIELAAAAEAAIGASQKASELKVRALVLMDRLEEARALLAPMDRALQTVARLHVLLGAAGGDDSAASRAQWEAFDRSGWRTDNTLPGEMEVLALTGDRATANQLAAMVDARPGGPMKLASVLDACLCGAPFDLDSAPNFKARVEESGFQWPPPTLFKRSVMAAEAARES